MKHALTGLLLLLPLWGMSGHVERTFFDGKFSLVPEIGINLSQLNGAGSNPQAGFLYGAALRLGKRQHFQTGLYHMSMRIEAEIDPDDPSSAQYRTIESNYLVIPVMMGYSLVNTSLFKLRAFGGVAAFSFINGSVKDALREYRFKETLWNVRAGIGVDVWRIEANASYDFSLSKMFDSGYLSKSRGLNLTLGFRF